MNEHVQNILVERVIVMNETIQRLPTTTAAGVAKFS